MKKQKAKSFFLLSTFFNCDDSNELDNGGWAASLVMIGAVKGDWLALM
jgi:hypothetical protein